MEPFSSQSKLSPFVSLFFLLENNYSVNSGHVHPLKTGETCAGLSAEEEVRPACQEALSQGSSQLLSLIRGPPSPAQDDPGCSWILSHLFLTANQHSWLGDFTHPLVHLRAFQSVAVHVSVLPPACCSWQQPS